MTVRLQGSISVPGDKSITHRSCMFAAIAEGESRVQTNVLGRDNLACIRVLGQLGVAISGTMTPAMQQLALDEGLSQFEEVEGELCQLRIKGSGCEGLQGTEETLDCGNSGTFARLLCGLLAGRPFQAHITGDESLVTRPFRRVTEPLSRMGATFSGDMLPFTMEGGSLKPITYESPHASAQVKSALLLAGLQCEGGTTVVEPHRSRDHSERMFAAMGCVLEEGELADGRWRVALPAVIPPLKPLELHIPGDFSAAAFFMVAASVFPDSELLIRNVGVNATRTGLLSILRRMGASIDLLEERTAGGEVVADLRVRSADLQGVAVDAEDVVLAIDEIPILGVAAACASGETVISGAAELRVKESDRLAMTAAVLRSFGTEVEELPDGLRILGQGASGIGQMTAPRDAAWRTSGDHRIAMSGAVLELRATGDFSMDDTKAVETSFPGFSELLRSVCS